MELRDLRALYAQLSDEDLAEQLAGGGLTDEAHALAAAVLVARGRPVPAVVQAPEPQAEPYRGDMVVLERGLSPTEAHLLCACLQSAGLHAEAGDTQIVQTYSLLAIAVGGASVRVPQQELADAQQVVAAFRRGEFALGDDFDPGTAGAS